MKTYMNNNSIQGSLPTNNITRYSVGNRGAYSFQPLSLEGRSVLIISYGNYTYARSLVDQHMEYDSQFPSRLVCSEYSPHNRALSDAATRRNISYLTDLGVAMVYNADVRDTDHTFAGHRFNRVQSNCLHDRSNYYSPNPTLPGLFQDAVDSINQVQDPGDELHLTLLQPGSQNTVGGRNLNHVYEGFFYRLADAVEGSGYTLADKRIVDEERYKYIHSKSFENVSANNAKKGLSEYVLNKNENPFARTPESFINRNCTVTLGGPRQGDRVRCSVYTMPRRRYNSTDAFYLERAEAQTDLPEPDGSLYDDLASLDYVEDRYEDLIGKYVDDFPLVSSQTDEPTV